MFTKNLQKTLKHALLYTFAIFGILISVATPMVMAQVTLNSFNPFGAGGIKCLYFYQGGANNPSGCTKDTGLLNRVESLLLSLAPAFAVLGVMYGGYNMMQDGIDVKGKGIKIVQGSIVGLMVIYAAVFIRDLTYTVINGTFNSAGGNANTINNTGVQAILRILRTVAYDILIPVGTPVAVGFVIVGGYMVITAAGDPKKVGTGLNTIRNAIVGFLFIVFSAALVSISQNIFGGFLGTIK